MFIFVFNWTPVLMEEPSSSVDTSGRLASGLRPILGQEGEPDPPFGHIFSGFMIMCMFGPLPWL